MAKRQYSVNKNYKSISIRFNIKSKEEKNLFNFLNSMTSEERTSFILSMYKQRGSIEGNNANKQMSIYEQKLFDLVEKAISLGPAFVANQDHVDQETNNQKKEAFKSNSFSKQNLNGSSVNYENIFFEKKKKNINYDNILDGFTEGGLKE